jgi:leucyl aminopeptidase (aminopeptidase T)
VDGMVRCIGKQDVNLLAEMGNIIIGLLSPCKEFRVTSELGTDVMMNNIGTEVGIFKMKASPEKTSIMLPGQISWLPVETSLNGKIVADGILYPPTEAGILQGTVEFIVKNGRIVDINGEKEARLLQDWLDTLDDDTMYRIAHVSLGFNPGIPVPTGRVMEDERAFGDIDFGFGAWVGRPAAGHFDMTCRNVSYWAGDVQLLDNGVFVHPDLAEICRKMGVSRH